VASRDAYRHAGGISRFQKRARISARCFSRGATDATAADLGAGFSAPLSRKTILLFFFHRHCDVSVCGEPDLVAFNTGNKTLVDEVVMALVRALAAVLFGQFDSAAFELVDRPTCTPSAPITSICSLISIFPSSREEGPRQGAYVPNVRLRALFPAKDRAKKFKSVRREK